MDTTSNDPHGTGAVLVTGASSGIGLATAQLLRTRGHLVFAGVRSEEQADALRTIDPELRPLRLEVRDDASRFAAMERLADELDGRPFVGLVNNAGIAVQGPLETVSLDDLRRQFEVNLFGLAGLVQLALPHLRASSRAGHRAGVVNIGSVGGRLPIPFNGPYNASKFALAAYSDCLRQELRPWNVRVSLVEPGTTRTARTAIWTKIEQSLTSVEGTSDGLYDAMLARYGDSVRRLQAGGIDPLRVAEVVHRALSARRPAHRTLVGDARLMATLTWVPTALRDVLLGRGLGLPRAGSLLRSNP